MASPVKRRRSGEVVDSQNIVIYYAPQKLIKARVVMMCRAMRRLGPTVVDDFSDKVTLLVSGFNTEEDVWKKIPSCPQERRERITIVSPDWHVDSVRAGSLLPTEGYRLRQAGPATIIQDEPDVGEADQEDSPEDYACQRRTPLQHLNTRFTDALEVLEEEANLRGSDQDYARALAFRNCSCVLKSLTFTVTSVGQVKGTKDVGHHCLKVIREILSEGSSREVESVVSSEWFQTMRTFTAVFGVGSSTAGRWYNRGLRSVPDVLTCQDVLRLQEPRLATGLAYHADLSTPVQRVEAEAWQALIHDELQRLSPGATAEITGGFRRGKSVGHDIDLLLSHPTEGREGGLLPRLLTRLQQRGLVVYGRYERSTYNHRILKDNTKHTPLKSTLDHFEKWIGVVRMSCDLVTRSGEDGRVGGGREDGRVGGGRPEDVFVPQSLRNQMTTDVPSLDDSIEQVSSPAPSPLSVGATLPLAAAPRDWVARRVDLIVAPADQYFYALLGWTGSKHFNRAARRYALNERNLRLSSHGLWDLTKGAALPARSEEEVFAHLRLKYRTPTERNC